MRLPDSVGLGEIAIYEYICSKRFFGSHDFEFVVEILTFGDNALALLSGESSYSTDAQIFPDRLVQEILEFCESFFMGVEMYTRCHDVDVLERSRWGWVAAGRNVRLFSEREGLRDSPVCGVCGQNTQTPLPADQLLFWNSGNFFSRYRRHLGRPVFFSTLVRLLSSPTVFLNAAG